MSLGARCLQLGLVQLFYVSLYGAVAVWFRSGPLTNGLGERLAARAGRRAAAIGAAPPPLSSAELAARRARRRLAVSLGALATACAAACAARWMGAELVPSFAGMLAVLACSAISVRLYDENDAEASLDDAALDAALTKTS